MSKGQEQTQAALEVCRKAAEAVDKAGDAEDEWNAERIGTLRRAQEALDRVMPKFFLKTKLCIPFTSRCEKAARRLDETLEELDGHPEHDVRERFTIALDALQKAAKVLEDCSDMQGMSIT